jgi:hypothetical protein
MMSWTQSWTLTLTLTKILSQWVRQTDHDACLVSSGSMCIGVP